MTGREDLDAIDLRIVSELQKDSNGNWAGTAMKDGKAVPVAVGVKGARPSTN